MISLCFYLLLLAIPLPSGSLGVKLEILLILPIATHMLLQLLNQTKFSSFPPSSNFNPVPKSLLALIILLLFSSLISSEKLIFYNLLMILFALICLFGYFNFTRILKLCRSPIFPAAILIISIAITFQSFTSVSSDGWDTLGTASGSVIARGSIGAFESNSLSVACSGLISLILFALHCNKVIKNPIKSINNIKFLYLSVILLTLSSLRTFSRTGLVAGMIAISFTAFPVIYKTITNSVLNLKLSRKSLILVVLLSPLSMLLILFLLAQDLDLLSVLFSRASFSSLTNDVRFEIWQYLINYYRQDLISGQGIFVFSDNFFVSQVLSNGLFLGSLISVLSMLPFVFLVFSAIQDYISSSAFIRFSTSYLASSALIYAVTSDFIGQSKTLPVLYLTVGMLSRFYSTRCNQ